MCKNLSKGIECEYGDIWQYAHSEDQIRTRRQKFTQEDIECLTKFYEMQENQPDKNKKSDDIEEAKVSESDAHDNTNDSLNDPVTPSHIEASSQNEIEDCSSKLLKTPSSQLDQIMPESTFENSISIGNLHDQYNFHKYKGQYEPKNYKDVS